MNEFEKKITELINNLPESKLDKIFKKRFSVEGKRNILSDHFCFGDPDEDKQALEELRRLTK